jgi:hypothetical protein
MSFLDIEPRDPFATPVDPLAGPALPKFEGLDTPVTDVFQPEDGPQEFGAPEIMPTPEESTIGFAELFGAAAATETTVGNIVGIYGKLLDSQDQLDGIEADPNYDALNDPQTIQYSQYAMDYAHSRSPQETGRILKRIDMIEKARSDLAAAGWDGIGALLAAGVIDPINLLPLGSLRKGNTLLQAAGEAAGIGVLASTGAEALARMHQGQARTWDESLTAITADTLLMGAFGAGAQWLKGVEPTDEIGEFLKEELSDIFRKRAGKGEATPQAAGAAPSPSEATLEQNTPIGTWGVGDLNATRNTPVGSPMPRMVRSPSNESRNKARQLGEAVEHFEGEKLGVAAPRSAETLYHTNWERRLFQSFEIADEMFFKYRGVTKQFAAALRVGAGDAFKKADGVLDRQQFRVEVTRALRNGDKHAIPEVAETARHVRENILNPLKEAAIELELLDPDVKVVGAETYFTRIYDTDQISAFKGVFLDKLKAHFAKERDLARKRDPKDVENWRGLGERAQMNVGVLTPVIAALRDNVVKFRKAVEKSSRQFPPMIAAEKIYKKQFERFDLELAAARARAQNLTPNKLPEGDPILQEIADYKALMNGKLKEPKRITERVREVGGIIDENDILKNKGLLSLKRERGVIALPPLIGGVQKGITIDEALETLVEEGWVTPLWDGNNAYKPISVDDLLRALDLDFDPRGKNKKSETPIYNRLNDADYVVRYENAQDFAKWARMAKATPDMPAEEIAYRMGALPNYKPDTPVNRAGVRGAEFYARRVEQNMEQARKEFVETKDRLDARSRKHLEKQKLLDDAEAVLEERVNELRASKRLANNYLNRLKQHVEIAGLPDGDIAKAAEDVMNNILSNNGRGLYNLPTLAGRSLRERTLTLPDNEMEEFLVNDFERVLRLHVRQMGADIEITRKFGSPDMADAIDDIKNDYNQLLDELPDVVAKRWPKLSGKELEAKVAKASIKLQDNLKSDIRDFEAMRDRLTGRRSIPSNPDGILHRASIFFRNFNLLRLGGGFALSSVPDVGSIAMSHGMARVMGRKGLMNIIAQSKISKSTMREVKLLGTALDLVLDTRANNLADIGDDYGRFSKFERGMKYAADKYGLINGMSIWNSFVKQWAGLVSITRTLEACEAVAKGTIKEKEMRRLLWQGIDPDMAKRIHRMADKHGATEGGVRWANVEAWLGPDGQYARLEREALGAAIIKDVDSIIVTPGIGDKPLWLDAEGTRLIGQFRSFFLSSAVRITTRGLQERDMNTLQGAALMTTLGALAYYLKTPDEKLSDNPGVWIKEAVDRSGLTGWFMEANNMTEKFTGNSIGLSGLFNLKPSQRYASRGFVGNLAGPTWGLFDEAAGFAAAAGTGTWGENDTERAANMIPMWKTFYFRWLRESFDDEEPETQDQL